MDYGRIVKRAWHITWRNKVLWIFGIAAALFGASSHHGNAGSGQSAQFIVNLPGLDRMPNSGRHLEPFMRPGQGFRPPDWGFLGPMMPRVLPIIGTIIAVLAILGLISFVVGLIVRYTSYGSLISMVGELEESDTTSFKSGLVSGWRRLLHLLATDIIVGIAAFVMMMVALIAIGIVAGLPLVPGIVLVSTSRNLIALGVILIIIGALLGALLLVVVGIAVGGATSLVRDYAFRASVLDQVGVFEGLTRALDLIKSKTRESVLMWILMVAIELAMGILTIPFGLMAVAGMVGPGALMYAATESIGATLLAAIPGILVVAILSAFVGGIYYCFKSATWTLTYRELRSIETLAE